METELFCLFSLNIKAISACHLQLRTPLSESYSLFDVPDRLACTSHHCCSTLFEGVRYRMKWVWCILMFCCIHKNMLRYVLWPLAWTLWMLWTPWKRKCIQRPSRRDSRKYDGPHFHTKPGNLVGFFFLVLPSQMHLRFCLPPAVLAPLSLRFDVSGSWCWVEEMWAYCRQWIAETESEMSKPHSYCLLISPVVFSYSIYHLKHYYFSLSKERGNRWNEDTLWEVRTTYGTKNSGEKRGHKAVHSPVR